MAQPALQGRTRWKRFAAVLVLLLIAASALMVSLARGAIGASFAVSGASFKTSASQLRGTGFAQFSAVDRGADGARPVARTAIGSASMDNFCQSAVVTSLPLVGDITLVIRAAGRDSVQAKDLVINISTLAATLTFQNIDIGLDASQLTSGPAGIVGSPGAFAQQADRIVLEGLRQTAHRLTASTLSLTGSEITVTTGRHECF